VNTKHIRSRARGLAVAALAAAGLVAAATVAAAAPPDATQRVIMPRSCTASIYHFLPDARWSYFGYRNSGTTNIDEDQGKLSFGGSLEQPRSFTDVEYPGPYGSYRGFLGLRKNGELWSFSAQGNDGRMIASRWSGITKITGTDNGIVYAVTATGGLNAYRFDGSRVRAHDVIGTKGWTSLKSISGYARADGNDSIIAVNAAGELVDYVIAPSGATRASYPTQWKAGISQVAVGECDDTPGRPIFAVIGTTMYAYYDRDALNGPHTALQDLSSAGEVYLMGPGWTGLIG
jgi:hypothetical protein